MEDAWSSGLFGSRVEVAQLKLCSGYLQIRWFCRKPRQSSPSSW